MALETSPLLALYMTFPLGCFKVVQFFTKGEPEKGPFKLSLYFMCLFFFSLLDFPVWLIPSSV